MGIRLALYGYDTDLGRLVLECVAEAGLEIDDFYPLCPLRGEYDAVKAGSRHYMVDAVDDFDFSKADVAILCCTQDETHRLCGRIRDLGCVVIDASHLYSGTGGTPVILPQINPEIISKAKETRLVIPAMSLTTQIALTVERLTRDPGIRGLSAVAMVSASEHGRNGTETLARETAQLLNGLEPERNDFQGRLAFNLHSAVGGLALGRENLLELTVRQEYEKLLGKPEKGMDITCVQVPVFYGHTVCLRLELKKACAIERVRAILEESPYLNLVAEDRAVSCVVDAVGSRSIVVHRLRKGESPEVVNLVCMMDNWRVGEALSCVHAAALLSGQKIALPASGLGDGSE